MRGVVQVRYVPLPDNSDIAASRSALRTLQSLNPIAWIPVWGAVQLQSQIQDLAAGPNWQ